MNLSKQLSTQLKQVYFGGNWTAVNFKDTLDGVTLEIASQHLESLNSILALSYHIHYYIKGTLAVLKGGDLTIRDKYSFDHPKLDSETEWQAFKERMWLEAEDMITHIKALETETLNTHFVEEKYGSYYRNFAGLVEHTHYHLGQIALIKKLILR